MRRIVFGVVLALTVAAPAAAGPQMWYGGGIGLWFGDVDYVEVQPIVGVTFTERVSGAVSLLYRYRDDGRYSPSVSTTDWGGSVLGRVRLFEPVFLQAEYEYLEYEFVRIDRSKVRDSYDSVLVGAGFSQATGGRMSVYAVALYNLSYSTSDPGPYDDPWVVRAGVAFGF